MVRVQGVVDALEKHAEVLWTQGPPAGEPSQSAPPWMEGACLPEGPDPRAGGRAGTHAGVPLPGWLPRPGL